MHKTLIAGAALAALMTGARPAAADVFDPLLTASCPGVVDVEVGGFRADIGHVYENSLFASGSLWVTDSSDTAVKRFAPDGTLIGIVPGPGGGLAEGKRGEIYAGVGNGLPGAALESGASAVVRFDPDAGPDYPLTLVSQGFHMANGMVLGHEHVLFVSNDVNEGLIAIDLRNPDTLANWSLVNDLWGANGLVVDPEGKNLYAAITFDQRSPIYRVPLDEPDAYEVAAELSFGFASLEPAVYDDGDPDAALLGVKGLDDMTRDRHGALYVVANGLGQLLRVDPDSGESCLLADGLSHASSVSIAPENTDFADGIQHTFDFYVSQFTGDISRVVWCPGCE
jgi:sugar lactone lactonase YvrE